MARILLEEQPNKGQANGYAGLDATGKVPAGQLPPFDAAGAAVAAVAAIPADAGASAPSLRTAVGGHVLAAIAGTGVGLIAVSEFGLTAGGSAYYDPAGAAGADAAVLTFDAATGNVGLVKVGT